MDRKYPVRRDSSVVLFGQIPDEPAHQVPDKTPDSTVRSLTPTFDTHRRLSFSKSVCETVDQTIIPEPPPADTKNQESTEATRRRMDHMLDMPLVETRGMLPAITGPTRLERLADFCKANKGEIAVAVVGTTAVAVIVAFLVAPRAPWP